MGSGGGEEGASADHNNLLHTQIWRRYCPQNCFGCASFFFFFFQRAHDVVTRPPVPNAERSARRSSLKTRYLVGRRGKRSPNTVIYKWPHVSTTTRRPPRLRTRRKVRTFSHMAKFLRNDYQLLHPKSEVILILWPQCHQIGHLFFDIHLTLRV